MVGLKLRFLTQTCAVNYHVLWMLVASHFTSLDVHCLASKVGTVRPGMRGAQVTLPVAPHFGQLSDIAVCCVLFPTEVGKSPLLIGSKVSPQSQTQMPGVQLPLPPSPARTWLGTCSLSLLATGEAAEGPAREQWGTLRRLLGAKPEVLKGHLISSNPNCQAFALSFFLCSS